MPPEGDRRPRVRRDWEPPSRAVLFLIALVVALVVAGVLVYSVRTGGTMNRIGSFYNQSVE